MGCIIKQEIKIAAAVMLLGVNLFAQYPQSYPQQPPAGYPPNGQGYPNAQSYPPQQYPEPAYGQAPQYGSPSMGEENPDDPTRGVARVSVLEGAGNVRRGDSGEVVAASVNAPLMSQDHVITGPGSRAEVQFDSANMIRLAPGTEIGLADLEYRRYQVQVARGTVMYSVLRESQAQAEIDTPAVAIRPQRFGEYRISVFDDGTTQLTVRAGEAEILGPQGSEQLGEGHTMLIRSGPQGPEFQTSWAPAPDDFDQWNVARDQQLQRSQSYRYVPSDIYGAEDLDQYGRWVPSEYGQAWVPSDMPANWAPYSNGQWTWLDYYGWTWVDAAPWGWAPFHYGRWFWQPNYGWAWFPGALRGVANFWRPALVGFFGLGGLAGAALGIGSALGSLFGLFSNIGWCPLAPYEPFHAWYGHGYYNSYYRGGGFGNGNFVRGANVASMFRNASFNNAVSYASSTGFGNGQQRFLSARSTQLTQAALVRGPLPLAPTRQSLSYTGRSAFSSAMPGRSGSQGFYTRMQGTSVARVPFGTQSHALQQFSQHTLGTTLNRGYTASSGAYASGQGFTASTRSSGAQGYGSGFHSAQPSASGWHSFGQSSVATGRNAFGGNSYSGSTGSTSSGWHVFGQPHQTEGYSRNGSISRYSAPQNSYRGYSGLGNTNGQPLRLNQPMVQQRNYGYQGPNYGGSRTYNAPAPRYNYGAPRQNYSAPKQNYRAPQYKAPKSNGGGSRGGGGGGGSRGGGGGHGGGGHRR